MRHCFDKSQCNDCNIDLNHPGQTTNTLYQIDYDNAALCVSTACNCIITWDNDNLEANCIKKRAPGESCNADQECESSNCNFAWSNTCAPSPNDSSCDNNADCQSGICNTADNTGSKCIAAQSLVNDGDDCIEGMNMCKPPMECQRSAWTLHATDAECVTP